MAADLPLRLLARDKEKFYLIDPRQHNVRSYDIISYAWGEPEPEYVCDIQGVDWAINLPRQRLHEIKRLMTEPGAEIEFLWCDAVCINQKDPAEQSSEISRMYEYYKNARKCHILLGLDNVWEPQEIVKDLKYIDHIIYHLGGSTLAAEARLTDNLAAFLSRWANENKWNFRLDKSLVQSAAIELGVINCYSTCIDYVRSLFDNLYFSRVWTFQEMLLGRNITMWGINEKKISCIGELNKWMDLAADSTDKADKLHDWILESRKVYPESVNAVLAAIEEDMDLLEYLKIQVRGISSARMDIINGGPFWWYENHRGVANVFSAISLTQRKAKHQADVFKGLLGVFHGLFTAEQILSELSGNDVDALMFAFFKQLSIKTEFAWTKLAISSGERREWDWIPVTASSDRQLTTDCFAGVVRLGRFKQKGNIAKADAIVGLEGAPRKYATLTLNQVPQDTSGFDFSFKGCNCGKTLKTGMFKREPIPLHDQPRNVSWGETGRTLVQCATVLGSLLNPGISVVDYRYRLLDKLAPKWKLFDPNAKPRNWIARCVSGTPWQAPDHEHIRVHNLSMSFRMPDVTGCESRLHNASTASVSCELRMNCGCVIVAPFALMFEAISAIDGSSLGGVAAKLDNDDRIELKDGLGLVQVGDVGKTFNLVAFGGDNEAHRAYSSLCKSIRDGRPVQTKLPWPQGRALVREEFSHGLMDKMRDYGYVYTGGSGNLLISRNHIADDYRIIGVCIDELIASKKGGRVVNIK